MAHGQERLGRFTDRIAKQVDVSGRHMRRMFELERLVRQLFGEEKVKELRKDMLAGRTAPVYTMLRVAKSLRDEIRG